MPHRVRSNNQLPVNSSSTGVYSTIIYSVCVLNSQGWSPVSVQPLQEVIGATNMQYSGIWLAYESVHLKVKVMHLIEIL